MKKKFTIKCNSCESENVLISEEVEEDFNGNMVGIGSYYLKCTNCGETDGDY